MPEIIAHKYNPGADIYEMWIGTLFSEPILEPVEVQLDPVEVPMPTDDDPDATVTMPQSRWEIQQTGVQEHWLDVEHIVWDGADDRWRQKGKGQRRSADWIAAQQVRDVQKALDARVEIAQATPQPEPETTEAELVDMPRGASL